MGLQDSPTWTKTGKPKQWALECGKGGQDGVKEENIVFNKRHKIASSTSHKNVACVPASPLDISAFAPEFMLS